MIIDFQDVDSLCHAISKRRERGNGRENPKGNKEILEIEGDVVSCLYEHGGLFLSSGSTMPVKTSEEGSRDEGRDPT